MLNKNEAEQRTDWERAAQVAETVVLDDEDAPELTDALLAASRPGREILPEILPAEIVSQLAKRGRPKSSNPRQQITLRLSPEVLEYFQGTGKGWQTRINQVLCDYVGQQLA